MYDLNKIYQELTGNDINDASPSVKNPLTLKEFNGHKIPDGASVVYNPDKWMTLQVVYKGTTLGVNAEGQICTDMNVSEKNANILETNWKLFLDKYNISTIKRLENYIMGALKKPQLVSYTTKNTC
ncbi:MAG: hypothetical protein KAI53_03180 [Candidatus Aenigmarchaeota archaeon]|nr:hypothetical protein [Candidatus Aenigmarchaeota archaeon]